MQRADRNPSLSVMEHVQNAGAHIANGNASAALANLDLAFLATPGNPYVRLLRGRVLSMLGRAEAALTDLDAAIAIDSAMAEAWLERSKIRLDRSEWCSAASDASRALQLDGAMAQAWRIRGIARYKFGLLSEAAEDLKLYLCHQPDDPSGHYWRGLAERDAGHNHSAVTEFDAAIRLNADYTEAYVARGKAHSNLGDMAAARSDWAVAAQMLHHSH